MLPRAAPDVEDLILDCIGAAPWIYSWSLNHPRMPIPEPPQWVHTWARELARRILRASNAPSLHHLYERARSLGFDRSPDRFGTVLGLYGAGLIPRLDLDDTPVDAAEHVIRSPILPLDRL